MSQPVGPPRARRLRWPPPLVAAATVAFGAVAALWSVVTPLGEGPDEPSHVGLVLHLADRVAYPDHDALARQVGVVRLCRDHAAAVRACPAPGEEVTAGAVRRRVVADAPPRATRPAWDDDGGGSATAATNQMPQHPPLAYTAMAVVLRAERAVIGRTPSLDREVALLRLVNALLVLPIPALAWAAARRAGASSQVAELAALLPFGIPMLAATGATVNNDGLLVVLGALLAVLLAGVATGDRRLRTGAGVGAVVGAALLTKAFAVVFLPVVAVAYLVAGRRRATGGGPAAVARPLGAAAGVVVAVAGGWYGWVWLRTGSPVASVDADRYTEALRPPGFAPDLATFVDRFSGLLLERVWGSFGWYTVRIPGWLTVGLTAVAAVLVGAGLAVVVRADRRRRAHGEQAARGVPAIGVVAVLLAPALLLAVLTASRAWSLHARSGQYPFIQGRYLFAGVVGPVVVAALGLHRLVRSRRGVVVATVLATLGLHLFALHRALVGWWGSTDASLVARLDAVVAWGGLPPSVAVLVAVAAVCAMATLTVVAVASDVPSGSSTAPVGSETR